MKTFIFDLDDTLKNTVQDYSRIVTKFFMYLYEHPELKFRTFSIKKLIQTFDEINNRDMKKYGRGKDVFPNSLLKTTKIICKENDIKLDKKTTQDILEIGYSVYDGNSYEGSLVKGGKEVLEFLRGKKDDLYLVTRGNEKEQMKKVEVLGIQKYFTEIYVPNSNKLPYFETIAKNKDKEKTYSIGDSIESDINPATEVGIKAIHIHAPLGGWNDYEVIRIKDYGKPHSEWEENIKNPERVLKFESVEEIVEKYENL